MLRNHIKFAPLALAGVLGLSASAAMATTDDDNTNGVVEVGIFYFIESDPNDSAKFEQYRDVPEGLTLPHFNLNWEQSKDVFGGGYWVDLDGVDVIEKDQRLSLGFGSRGLWKGVLKFQENPHQYGDFAQSPYSYQGDGVFTLVDGLQTSYAAGGAVGPTAGNPWRGQTIEHGVWDAGTKGAILRDATMQSDEVDVGYQRKTGSAQFEFTPTKAWRITVGAERERRDGTMPKAMSFGFNTVSELAVPVDYQTDTFNLGAEYSGKHWVLGAKYLLSDFTTDEDTVIWDNINRTADAAGGPGRGQYSLGTDNEWDQWQVYFGANLPGHTRINATYSQSSATQNDDFLPPTINSLILAGAHPENPAESYHGEIDNDLLDIRINSRPLDWLRLKAWYRDYEQDNNSPWYEFEGQVNYDTNIGTNATAGNPAPWLMRANVPFGYDKVNWGALAGFQPADWVEFALSWETEDMERNVAAVTDSSEDTWKLTADFDLTKKLFLRAGYSNSERSAHHYDAEYWLESFPNGESVIYAGNEGSRKFYQTDRDKETWSLMLDVSFTEKFGMYAEVQDSSSDYSDPNTGQRIGTSFTEELDQNNDGVLEEEEIRLAGRVSDDTSAYTVGFSITPNDNWDIHVDYSWENFEWDMASTYRAVTNYPYNADGQGVRNVGFGQDDPLGNWDNFADEDYETFTLGFHGKWAEGKWEVMGDISVSSGEGDQHVEFVPGGNASSDTALTDFPQLQDDFTVATLGFERHLPNGWDIGFKYWYEDWSEDNWTTDYSQAYVGNPTQDPAQADWIHLGLDFSDYTNHILQLTARYSF